MDKALACQAGGQGLNPDMTKYLVLLISRVPTPRAPSMPFVTCSSLNICHGGGKKKGIMVNTYQGHL